MIEYHNGTDHADIWLQNGIIFFVYKPHSIITVDVAKKMVHDRLIISNGIVRPLFIDVRNLISIDTPSRNYLASFEAEYLISAVAVLVGTSEKHYISMLAAKVFLEVDRNNTKIPGKLFTSQQRALEWLAFYKYLN